MKEIKKFSYRIFTKSNLNKAIIIFIIGFISRIGVNYIYDINVYLEYLNIVSFIYYIWMSLFIVLIHELIIFFDINIIPSFIYDFCSLIIKHISIVWSYISRIYLNIKIVDIRNITISELTISSIKNTFNLLLREKDKSFFKLYDMDCDDKPICNKDKVELPKIDLVLNKENIGDNTTDNNNNNVNTDNSYSNNYLLPNRTYVPNRSELPTLRNSTYSGNTNMESNRSSSDFTHEGNISVTRIPISFDPHTISMTPRYGTRSINNGNGDVSSSSIYNIMSRYDVPHEAPRPSNLSSPNISELNTPMFPPLENSSNDNYIRPNIAYNISNARNYTYSDLVPNSLSNNNSHIPYQTSSVYSRSIDHQNTILANSTQTELPFVQRKEGLMSPPIENHPVLNDSVPPFVPSNDLLEREDIKIKEELVTVYNKEIPIKKSGLLGKFVVGFDMLESKISETTVKVKGVYAHYENVYKRKFFWHIWEENKGIYKSYEDFKANWDPKTKFWDEIKKRTKADIKADIEELLGVSKISGKIGKGTTGEIEDLLRKNRPFVHKHNPDPDHGHKHSHKHNRGHGHGHKSNHTKTTK